MNKMFTAIAVLQPVQAGELALDDRVGELLRDHALETSLARVTVHQLLTHTGSTGDIFGPAYEARRRALRTIGDYVQLHRGRALRSAPGSHWEYSNYGYILLGAIVEAESGEDYHARVGSRIFAPAGMASTASRQKTASTQAGRCRTRGRTAARAGSLHGTRCRTGRAPRAAGIRPSVTCFVSPTR